MSSTFKNEPSPAEPDAILDAGDLVAVQIIPMFELADNSKEIQPPAAPPVLAPTYGRLFSEPGGEPNESEPGGRGYSCARSAWWSGGTQQQQSLLSGENEPPLMPSVIKERGGGLRAVGFNPVGAGQDDVDCDDVGGDIKDDSTSDVVLGGGEPAGRERKGDLQDSRPDGISEGERRSGMKRKKFPHKPDSRDPDRDLNYWARDSGSSNHGGSRSNDPPKPSVVQG
ncbi:hypothetical protein HK101_001536 [Irineochytrium annulatum]|nr:hypothetical protein HK101_001536 [Irineochytrium annulatum]